MAMGMSYQEFWDASPFLVVSYRKAYKLKREAENEMAWLQGLYNYHAFSICLANAFSTNGKRYNYAEKPLDIFPLTEAEKKKREQEEIDKMYKQFEEIAKAQRNKKKAKEQKKQGGD